MTKAKEAMAELQKIDNEYGQYALEDKKCAEFIVEHSETIRKALELLDKVEQGGLDVNVLEKPKGMTLDEKIGFMECRAIIQAKYILIER